MIRFLSILTAFLLISVSYSFAQSVQKNSKTEHHPLNAIKGIVIYGEHEKMPLNAEFIKEIKTGKKGFKSSDNYEIVIREAKIEARKSGGNAIKIVEHILPAAFVSPNHRMTVDIFRISEIDETELKQVEETVPGIDYAILNIYRYGGSGFIKNYFLIMDDSTICKISSNFSKTIQIKKEGIQTIWAQTEVRSQVTVDFKFGNVYYLRCGISMGTLAGIPKLEIVDSRTGKSEFASFISNGY